ncbi:hypothetical protein ACQPZZ_02920 [Microbispora sp. CA-135349]|uniref:hypothetical protein n=1 Tax=Microbispora sp. CA-135349 TaxID=3239953 RepID=UPI003D924014
MERAVNDWPAYGLNGRDKGTVAACAIRCNTHIIPALGARKLRDLSAENVQRQKEQQEREREAAGERWQENNGLPLEEISRLVGHSSTAVTEAVYRKQIRPVLQAGAVAMDRIFDT